MSQLPQMPIRRARSKPMRECTCGELRELARTNPTPGLARKVEQLARFADHQVTAVQVADLFPDGQWPETVPAVTPDASEATATADGAESTDTAPAGDGVPEAGGRRKKS